MTQTTFVDSYFMLVLLPFCRSQPINSFVWGNDTVISARFNPGEPNLLASSARYTAMLISMIQIQLPHTPQLVF